METFMPIASTTLSSSAATVTFSGIPQTYKHLVLKCSVRTDFANVTSSGTIHFNASGTTAFSLTSLLGDGSTASSTRNTSRANTFNVFNGANSTSNTFSNNEIFIPNYTGSTNKPYSNYSVVETNATAATVRTEADLYSSSSPITSITIEYTNIVSGSTFDLYGIV